MPSNNGELEGLLKLICQRAGLVFPHARMQDIRAAVDRSRVRLHVRSIHELEQRIKSDVAALDELVAELTVGETYFFRDPAQLEVIRDTIIPSFERKALRAWSAGCASGEEAYTLAMLMHETGVGEQSSVLGTDISRPRLTAARRARYGRWSLRAVTKQQEKKFFEADGRLVCVKDEYRSIVEFAYLNLADDAYPSISTGVWGMDIILCRNVLIYFDRSIVERVANALLATLNPDGWLVLGAADPPINALVDCETIVTAAGLFYRKLAGVAPKANWHTIPSTFSGAGPAHKAPSQSTRQPKPAIAASQLDVHDWIARVRALANSGLVREATREAVAALKQHPLSAELLFLRAVLAYEQMFYTDAFAAARRALYLDRDFVVAHVLMANIYKRLGQPAAARRALLSAQSLLAQLAPDAIVPSSDGESAARLAEMVKLQLQFLGDVA